MNESETRGTLQPGEILNNTYVIDMLVGLGGTGEVYRAHNKVTGRLLAVKILRREFAADENFINLMRREASVLHEVVDDAVVRYYDLLESDTHGGFVFLVMEFIEGPSLAQIIKEKGPMAPGDLMKIAGRVAKGLKAAHDKKAFHRDLSPDNVILRDGSPDKAVLIDFGIARDVNENAQTVVGDGFAGKYQYASPEQMDGKVDARSDLYSLGITLLTGFRGKPMGVGASLMEIVQTKMKVVDTSDIPEPLGGLIARLVAPRPEDRFQSAQAVIQALRSGAPVPDSEATVIAPRITTTPGAYQSHTGRTSVNLPPEPISAKRKGGGLKWLFIVLLLGAMGGGGWYFGLGPGKGMIFGPSYPLEDSWQFEARFADGRLQVESHVQGPEGAADLRAALGLADDAGDLENASGAPLTDWEMRMAALVAAARPLSEWSVIVNGLSATIEGVAQDEAQSSAVTMALRAAATPAGIVLNIALRSESRPLELAIIESAIKRYETCGPLRPSGGDGVVLQAGDRLAVSGIIARESDIEVLQAALDDVLDGRQVDFNLAVLNEPVCLIDNMLPSRSSIVVNLDFRYGDREGEARDGVYHLGENPVIEVTLPSGAVGYLTAFYVDQEGQVFHLLPHMSRPENNLVRLGEMDGALRRVRLSWPVAEASTEQLGFNVVEPVGTNMVVAIVTDTPLFDRMRPRAESVSAFMDAFRGRAMVLELSQTMVTRRYLVTEE
ncbi:MAG: serine/threonine-protein kinase [Paracoccaceae bacterium]